MRANRGRPKKEVRRDVRTYTRLTADEYEKLREMASEYNLSVSDLIRTFIKNSPNWYNFDFRGDKY